MVGKKPVISAYPLISFSISGFIYTITYLTKNSQTLKCTFCYFQKTMVNKFKFIECGNNMANWQYVSIAGCRLLLATPVLWGDHFVHCAPVLQWSDLTTLWLHCTCTRTLMHSWWSQLLHKNTNFAQLHKLRIFLYTSRYNHFYHDI